MNNLDLLPYTTDFRLQVYLQSFAVAGDKS
jgi:hypothetical protein